MCVWTALAPSLTRRHRRPHTGSRNTVPGHSPGDVVHGALGGSLDPQRPKQSINDSL